MTEEENKEEKKEDLPLSFMANEFAEQQLVTLNKQKQKGGKNGKSNLKN